MQPCAEYPTTIRIRKRRCAIDKFLDNFRDAFLDGIVDNLTDGVNKRKLIKNIRDLYISKGTRKGHELFFRLLFNDDAVISYQMKICCVTQMVFGQPDVSCECK